jgi:hypothetical protein
MREGVESEHGNEGILDEFLVISRQFSVKTFVPTTENVSSLGMNR